MVLLGLSLVAFAILLDHTQVIQPIGHLHPPISQLY